MTDPNNDLLKTFARLIQENDRAAYDAYAALIMRDLVHKYYGECPITDLAYTAYEITEALWQERAKRQAAREDVYV